MWLTLDIGNSRIKGGLFEGDVLRHTFTMQSAPEASLTAYRHSLRHHLKGTHPERIGIASVVPELSDKIQQALQMETWTLPEFIHHRMRLPFSVEYLSPERLGTDRLAAAAGATRCFEKSHPAHTILVIDAGTAVTFEVIRQGTHYEGGLILPGPQLMNQALHRGTAQLPEVSLTLPPSPVGRSTGEAIQAGIMYGFLEAVRGILHQLVAKPTYAPALCIATGGWGHFLKQHIPEVEYYEPHLVLKGIRDLLELNQQPVLRRP